MLPTDAAARKEVPLSTVLDYFPDAFVEVARLIKVGNDQHNPGEPIYWNRDKSGDEADALLRHFLDRGTNDTDGVPHSAKVVWRALALFQKELEAAHGLPISRGSRSPKAEAEAAQTPREAFVEGVTETEAPLEAVPTVKVGDRLYNSYFKTEGTVSKVYGRGGLFEVYWDNREYGLDYVLGSIDGIHLRFV